MREGRLLSVFCMSNIAPSRARYRIASVLDTYVWWWSLGYLVEVFSSGHDGWRTIAFGTMVVGHATVVA